ncbi:MAG TPA: hypothetical protein VGD99_05975 [Anaerolineae bacterium]|jgi:hypothetical protein
MRTIHQRFTRDTSFWQRLGRDVRLLWCMAQMLYAYLIIGRRIRQTYRAKEARGDVFWVDEELPR